MEECCHEYSAMNLDNSRQKNHSARSRAGMVQSWAARSNASASYLAAVWCLTFAVSAAFVSALH